MLGGYPRLVTEARMTCRIVRCRSVSPPSGARRSWVLSGPAVVVRVSVRSSLMAPNVVAERPRIKHVFEVCREFSLAGRRGRILSVPRPMVWQQFDHMFY